MEKEPNDEIPKPPKRKFGAGIKKFFSSWIAHRRAIQKEKVKHRTDFNWNMFLMGLLCSLTVLLIFSSFFTAYIINSATTAGITAIGNLGSSVAAVAEVNPELFMGLRGESSKELLIMTIAKQISAEAGVSGNFTGRFTTRTLRETQKWDPNCIDEYTYGYFRNHGALPVDSAEYIRNLEFRENLSDKGCAFYSYTYNYTYYKCPKNNCKRVLITREVLDEFIPEKVIISKVEAGANPR